MKQRVVAKITSDHTTTQHSKDRDGSEKMTTHNTAQSTSIHPDRETMPSKDQRHHHQHRIEPSTGSQNAFRLDFTCQHTGRYYASSKRKLTWRFGIWNKLSSSLDGRRDEEQEVELIWSLKSGKVRLRWNNQDISHLLPATGPNTNHPGFLDFVWQSSSQVTFRIIAHAEPIPAVPQYDLLIDDRSYFSLPSLPELITQREQKSQEQSPRKRSPKKKSPQARKDEGSREKSIDSPRRISVEQLQKLREHSPEQEIQHQQQIRLSSAGFSCRYELQDELRSDLYSSTLDALRDDMAASVPATEEMMSRAIINAFSEDHDSSATSIDSFSLNTELHMNPLEKEADELCNTFEWIKWNSDYEPHEDIDEMKLEFMQKHIETMVSHVRHDRLSPHDASRIMINVAAILEFELAIAIKRNTVVLTGLNTNVTVQDVYDQMHVFGEIEAAAVAREHDGFAFCRFRSQTAANRACEAAERNEVIILGEVPELIFELFSSPFPLPSEEQVDERDEEEFHRNYFIDPQEDAVETYLSETETYLHSSLPLNSLATISEGARDLHSSSSRGSISLPSSKDMVSNRTMSTSSTVEMDEIDVGPSAVCSF